MRTASWCNSNDGKRSSLLEEAFISTATVKSEIARHAKKITMPKVLSRAKGFELLAAHPVQGLLGSLLCPGFVVRLAC